MALYPLEGNCFRRYFWQRVSRCLLEHGKTFAKKLLSAGRCNREQKSA
jgi:hypothetical protein